MLYKLSLPVPDLRGTPIPGSSMSDLVANALCMGKSGSPAKAISIALKLVEKGEVELDDKDLELVRSAVTSSPILNDLATQRILEALVRGTPPPPP